MESKSGGKFSRNVFVAKSADNSVGYSCIAMGKDAYDAATSAYTTTTIDVNLTTKGTYYVLSSANISISALSVTYDENNLTTLEETPFMTSATDTAHVNPMDWPIGVAALPFTAGIWTFTGQDIVVKPQGERTLATSNLISQGIYLPAGSSASFKASGNGSVTLLAESNSTSDGAAVSYVKDGGTAVVATNKTAISGAKAWTASSTVNFEVAANSTYVVTADLPMTIYLLGYDAA